MSSTEWHRLSALALGREIAAGRIDPVELAEHFLKRIADHPHGEAIYLRTTPGRARAEAEASRARVKAGRIRGPLDGVPIAWKDLFDTAGVETAFGSAMLAGRVPARDCEVLARATRAGTVCLGKTNLSELAYSGLGINPVTGTPPNAADIKVHRVPGGSSSGSGVAVAAGLAPIGMGSDTGGSVRLPAAVNGTVGLKTTVGWLPLQGVLPLCPSYDTVGPLTMDVADANAIFAVMADRAPFDLAGASLKGARLLAPTTLLFDDLDDTVGAAMERAIGRLADAGAEVEQAPVPEIAMAYDVVARHGNVISAQAKALWGDLLAEKGDLMFDAIRARIDLADRQSAADAETVHVRMAELSRRFQARIAGYAGVICPTAPFVAPAIEPLLQDRAAYDSANLGITRNTRFGNLFELCGVTMPCQPGGALPVGLSLLAGPCREGAVLRLAAAAERALAD